MLILVLLILLLYGFLQTELGQNWLAGQLTKRFSRELQTRINIKYVKFNLFNFNKMDLEGVFVEDQKQDTLLYAGKLQVRITDWFFFKDAAELKYVGLENAVINVNRTDSVWNYTFLEKYFASTDTSSKKKAGISFDLKKVVMKNVSFIKKDAWLGNDMYVKIGGLDMDARRITVSDKTVDVTNLALEDPYFSSYSYSGKYISTSDPEKIDSTIKSSSPQWKINFGTVTVKNGRFRDDKGSMTSATTAFDGKHIDFYNINGSLKNIGWTADTVTGNINLTAKERSGFIVKSLKAKTTIHPQAMIFDDLHLETNRSVISNYFAMRYNSIGDMSDFLHAVTMEANFNRSTISSDDIAFFAPKLKDWNKNIQIDGEVRGTVDGISSEDLEVWAGNNTYIRGAVSVVGLPNINETLINIEAEDLRTTYGDAVSFIPAIRKVTTPNLNKLTYLRFQGTYTGFINDFVTYGTIQTNLGTLHTDLNMKFPKNGEPAYTGKLSTNGFQLGTFINSPNLGLVDFTGTVKGKGFKWQTLDMNIDGTVRRIQYSNYMYRNITAKGNLTNRLFNGDFVMKDPNADMHLKGLVDLTGKIPLFKATAQIEHADLKALGLTKEDFQLKGNFGLDMQASSLSDMMGRARISDASLISNGKRLSFDSLAVSSFYENGLKKLTAVSNEFNATVTGDFDLQELPEAFTLFLHKYYPSYIKPPVHLKSQVFTFDITTGVVEDYMRLIHPSITGLNNSHITGSLNTTANTMTVDADVPFFQYQQYQFSNIQLKGSGDLSRLTLTGEVGNAQIGDTLFFPQTSFSIQAQNDVSDVTINTSSNLAINKANLSAQVRTYNDGVSIRINPSSFVLNNKTWTLDQGGELNFRKNAVARGSVTFRESNQEIKLWTEPDDEGAYNNLRVAFQNVNVSDFSPFITKKNRIEGVLNGDATIEDPQNQFEITSNLRINSARLDNDSIGDVNANVFYNNKTKIGKIDFRTLNPEHFVEGTVNLNLKDSIRIIKVQSRLTNFEMKYLNRFLGAIFSDIQGYVTGNLDLDFSGSNKDVVAKARVSGASFKVNFTQVAYTIDDTEIELKKDLIDLNNIRIRDGDGNTALVKGYIRHTGFTNMYYDISVETESRQFELLNTTYYDNQQFFGTAKGTGTFVLVGPQNDMHMDIDLKASETEPSFITLPPSRSRGASIANFMLERKYGREMTAQSAGMVTNLTYDIRLQANPMVNIGVILDDLTGDAIRGKGTGDIRISSGTFEPLTIRGRYNIDEGDYQFNFQSLFRRPFILRKGGNNFIEWNGDPYEANVRLDAVYTANEVSFAPLVSSGLITSGINPGTRDDVNVRAILTGNLFRPDFNFGLEFPTNNPIYNSPDFQLAIQQIEKNQNELNKQVAYLIVFNSFAPYENLSNQGVSPFANELTYNTISGLLFGKVNEELNRVLSKILPTNATFTVTGSLYNRNAFIQSSRGIFALPNQTNIGLSLGLPLFNERARITLGGTFNVPLNSDVQTTLLLLPDVSFELLLNKSGSIRATFFYRQNADLLTGTAPAGPVGAPRRYGTSINYGKSFNQLRELFGKRKERDSIQKVKPDTTGKETTVKQIPD